MDEGSVERSPVERHVKRAMIDEEGGYGKPLSRRQRQTRRTLEAYLRAGVVPRYMQRLREIEQERRRQAAWLERIYRALRERFAGDPKGFERTWRERARTWNFERVNQLVREHNEWYPIERQLPMDPRTRDYVLVRGLSYRREELGPEWVLERFPPELEEADADVGKAARR
jgi:hypothetical protein